MSTIAVHMLSHRLYVTGTDGDAVRDFEPEGASREANGNPADRQRDDEDSPLGCTPHVVAVLQISHRKDLRGLYQREAFDPHTLVSTLTAEG